MYMDGGNKGSVLENVELTIENSTIGGRVHGGGFSSDDTSTNIYYKQYAEQNLSYAYIDDGGAFNVKAIDMNTYYINGEKSGNIYESFKWKNFDYLLTNSNQWTDEQKEKYLATAEENNLSSKIPNVLNGIDYTNKLVYSSNAGKMGTVYGDITLNIKKSTISKDIYGGGYGGQVQGTVSMRLENISRDTVYAGAYSGNVGGVKTTLDNCTITNYYNGGNRGNVEGDAGLTVNSRRN